MATWTTITDEALEPGKPGRSIDALALRDNAIAIAEGAPGAPGIASAALIDYPWGNEDIQDNILDASKFQTGVNERDWVLARNAAATAGVVGTYALLISLGLVKTAGQTESGSALRYANAGGNFSGVPSGAWMCLGYVEDEIDPAMDTTLWLRIL